MRFGLKNSAKNILRNAATGVLVAILVSACGGGGGSPGAIGGAGTDPIAVTVVPTIKIALSRDGVKTNSVDASKVTNAQATVLDDKNQPVLGKLVTFTADPTLIKFDPASGTALTDLKTGIATIQITPASLSSVGAGSLTATAMVVPTTGGAAVSVSTSVDYQLSAANLTLTDLKLASNTVLEAYGTRTVSVLAKINGVAATNTPIQVNFSASCGTITPTIATTDGTGTASSSYTADSSTGCSGKNVSILATAGNAASLNGIINVLASQATNVQFVGAAPQLLYLIGSTGATQSLVTFKVIDSTGNPMSGQNLTVSLINSEPGVSLGTKGNTSPIALSSNASGVISVPVFSGTIPTSVQVRAVLVANTTIATTSNILTVASGWPVQKSISLALETFSIEAFNIDGATTDVTFSMADRQGNPVPAGTAVNFVSSYGVMVPATCRVPVLSDGTSSSACTSSIRSGGTRPLDGKVAILAYTPGEEDFIDLDHSNAYDLEEPFVDLGNAYRDDNFNGVVDAGEFVVPRTGSYPCTGGINGRINTCDEAWKTIDVRAQRMVVFATGGAIITPIKNSIKDGIFFEITDLNGNSLPTGTSIQAVLRLLPTSGEGCSTVASPTTVANIVGATSVVVLPSCTGGSSLASGELVDIEIKSPSGIVTNKTITLTQ
ncbi:MAG: hypothetical protein ACOH2K_03110 [Burkholderiaceae bacterium]